MNEHFDNFDSVKHNPLKVFNRTIMVNNILEDFGEDRTKEYLEQFSDLDKRSIFIMMNFIKVKGYKAAKEAAMRDFKVEDEDVTVH